MTYNAVLFDLDGTLLDSIEDLADSMNEVLARWELPQHPVEAYKYFVGDGMEQLAERALPRERRDEATVARCIREMRQEYQTRWNAKTRPYAGIPEMLDALTERGMTKVVLSNKPEEFTRKMVAGLLSRWRFEVVAGQKPDVPIKPDPAGALRIAEQLEIPPKAFLYLGDTNTDMKTAVAAGMFPIGVLWGFREADELLAHGARVLLEKPMDLLDLPALKDALG